MSTTHPVRIETEWDEVQRKFGNLPAKAEEIKEEQMTKKAVEKAESIDFMDKKTTEELNEDEDDIDESVLEMYRRRRLQEFKEKKKYDRFGDVYHLGKDEFIQEVTKASEVDISRLGIEDSSESGCIKEQQQGLLLGCGTWVIVHLYKESVDACRLMNEAISRLAKKYPSVKFVKGISTDVVADYPDIQLPLILVYFGGVCRHQISGSTVWGGRNLCFQTVESVLAKEYKIFKMEPSSEDDDGGSTERRGKKYIAYKHKNDSGSDEEDRLRRDRGYSSVKLDSMVKAGLQF